MPPKSPKSIASLKKVTQQTPDTYTLRLTVPISFKPGQSIQLNFPGDSKGRYYSISSSPTEGDFLEITVKTKNDEGSLRKETLEALKTGDSLEILGPFDSSLSLPEKPLEPFAFIAAGTGATPFRSMARYLMDTSTAVDYWLLHSAKSLNDLLFKEEFSFWASATPYFHYIPTLTREPDPNGSIAEGRITQALLTQHVVNHPCLYFLCGPFAFVNDMEEILHNNLKVPKDRIRREKW